MASLVATTVAGHALVTWACVGDRPVTPPDSGAPDTGAGSDALHDPDDGRRRQVYPDGAFVDSGYLYWWAGNGPFAIRRAQIVASPSPKDVVAVSGNVVNMVATPTHVLWTQGQNTDILMAPANGGGTASSYVKGTLGDKPSALVRDAVALYWIDQADGSLHRVALP